MKKLLSLGLVLMSWAGMARAQVIEYAHMDALGSIRAVTDGTGRVLERHDYLPFGEEWNPAPPRPDNQPLRFTGKERDGETGLDYFGARYYGSRIARFTTTDPVYTIADNLIDPQRWNRYSYGLNNPYRYVDPDGRVSTEIARAQKALEILRRGGKLTRGGAAGSVVETTLEFLFGKNIFVDPGALAPHEVAFARSVAELEGRNFMGPAVANQPGIDGVLFQMDLFTSVTQVSLKETGGGLGSVLHAAQRAADQAHNAGFSNVALYVNAPNVDNVSMLQFIQGGKQNLLWLPENGTLSSITIFTKDGIVRSAGGKATVLTGPVE